MLAHAEEQLVSHSYEWVISLRRVGVKRGMKFFPLFGRFIKRCWLTWRLFG